MTLRDALTKHPSVTIGVGLILVVGSGLLARSLKAEKHTGGPPGAQAQYTEHPSSSVSSPMLTDYSGQDLSGADFTGQTLTSANFKGAVLVGARFGRAKADRAIFDDADLTKADFDSAYLVQASFRNAKLNGATLFSALLQGADLSGATLDGADLAFATGVTNRMLADALGVPINRLESASRSHRVRLDDLENLRELCGPGDPVPATNAKPYAAAARFHAMFVAGPKYFDTNRTTWTQAADKLRWSPVAVRFTQLVACATELDPLILGGTGCSYDKLGELRFAQERWRVSIFTAKTGKLVAERRFTGALPNRHHLCETRISGDQKYITGGPVTFNQVKAFLSGYVGQPPRA